MYYFARSPCICLIFCISYFVFLILTSIALAILCYCVKETFFPTDSPVSFVAPVAPVTTIAPDEANEMSYDEAYKFCLDRKKSLPLSINTDEEDEIIETIKNSAAGKCAYVFFAWQADAAIRYENRVDYEEVKFQNPTLVLDNTTADIRRGRYIYHVEFKDGKPVVVPLTEDDIDTRGFSALYLSTHGLGEECLKHRYKCIYARPPNYDLHIPEEYRKALREDKKLYGIVYIDHEYIPTSFHFLNPKPAYKKYLSLSCKYVFDYQFGDKRIDYRSPRFSVIDPEYNCMAYETGSGKMVTYPCDGPACPICMTA